MKKVFSALAIMTVLSLTATELCAKTVSDESDQTAELISGYNYSNLNAVRLGVGWGYLDWRGKEVIPPFFEDAEDFSEDLGEVMLADKWGYIDSNGTIVIPPLYDDSKSFSEGLAAVCTKGKWGYIDTKGKQVIDFKYIVAGRFHEGLAFVSESGEKDSFGFIDTCGSFVIPAGVYDGAKKFSEGYAPVKDNDKWGYANRAGKAVIPLKYEDAQPFSNGLAAVCSNGKWGYINTSGKNVINFKYDYAGLFTDKGAIVSQNGKSFIITLDENVLKELPDDLQPEQNLNANEEISSENNTFSSGKHSVRSLLSSVDNGISPDEFYRIYMEKLEEAQPELGKQVVQYDLAGKQIYSKNQTGNLEWLIKILYLFFRWDGDRPVFWTPFGEFTIYINTIQGKQKDVLNQPLPVNIQNPVALAMISSQAAYSPEYYGTDTDRTVEMPQGLPAPDDTRGWNQALIKWFGADNVCAIGEDRGIESRVIALLIKGTFEHQNYGIIAIRGTLTDRNAIPGSTRDWLNNFMALPVCWNWGVDSNWVWPNEPKVHMGFEWKTAWLYNSPKLQAFVKDIMKSDSNAILIVTGHSQGGADAVGLSITMLKGKNPNYDNLRKNKARMRVITFAGPVYGTKDFNDDIARTAFGKEVSALRFVREADLVSIVPPELGVFACYQQIFGPRYYQETGIILKNDPLGILKAHYPEEYLAWILKVCPNFVEEFQKKFR